MAGWNLATDYQGLSKDFGSLAAVFAIEGERLTKDPLSEVVRIEREGVRFYVKRYWGAGKGLRRYLGRPRVKAEWQNLKLFAKWGIPTAPIVAHGLERNAGAFVRGALVTRELENTQDLALMADQVDALKQVGVRAERLDSSSIIENSSLKNPHLNSSSRNSSSMRIFLTGIAISFAFPKECQEK